MAKGFKGTEDEWLASLKGRKVIIGAQGPAGTAGPVGKDGAQGPKGADGESAYQVAVRFGDFVGSEKDWLASLKGKDGAPGKRGTSIFYLIR